MCSAIKTNDLCILLIAYRYLLFLTSSGLEYLSYVLIIENEYGRKLNIQNHTVSLLDCGILRLFYIRRAEFGSENEMKKSTYTPSRFIFDTQKISGLFDFT